MSIGELDGPEEYLFGRIGSLAVDNDRNVYVFDAQALHVRVFDDAGTYIATLGREGEGPGEFGRAETIAVLPDGRLLVRDPGNMRVQVFDPVSGETDEWEYNSGNTYRSGAPLYTDVRGQTFLLTRDQSGDDIIIVLGTDGTHLDTLPEPSMTSSSGRSTPPQRAVPGSPLPCPSHPGSCGPFTPPAISLPVSPPTTASTWSVTTACCGIERDYEPVPVSDGERDYWRESTVQMIRFTVPDWTWDGPRIPDYKPIFKRLLTGWDGRIWVWLATEGERVENEDHDPENPFSKPVTWRESRRYDVFESDGTYLGVVVPPDGSPPLSSTAFMSWAVATDELGCSATIRMRMQRQSG